MIEIRNVQLCDGTLKDHHIESDTNIVIDASGLLLIPAAVDPHVHFRTPGFSYKENWQTGAKAAIAGGVTTVFDMPNTLPTTVNYRTLTEKKKTVQAELKEAQVPLRYYFYLGADKNHLSEIEKCKDEIIGVKIFMGSSTGDLLIDDINILRKVFEICKKHNLLIAVHAEDEKSIINNRKKFRAPLEYKDHSKIRDAKAAANAIKTLIFLCKEYRTKVYILHISTKKELKLIEKAKKDNLPIYAEVTPHHLFLSDDAYDQFQGRALVNPPLRKKRNSKALWDAIQKGIIDSIGSDHAPHTIEEKQKPYGSCPCGMPNIELTLPLLFNAYNEGKISVQEIVNLTSRNIHDIFDFPTNDDVVLVDTKLKKRVTNEMLHTKAKWSCFENSYLTGWPVYTIVKGKVFKYGKDPDLV